MGRPDFDKAWDTMANEEKGAYMLWLKHKQDQMEGEVLRAEGERDTFFEALEILKRNGMGTPGRETVGDVLPFVTADERAVLDRAGQAYERSFDL